MKYYKDENNQVYAYEADGSQDAYIPSNLIPITIEEADELRKPPPLTPEQLQEQINFEARAYLNSTDWYVVRFAETGVPIPQEILDARQAARDRIVDPVVEEQIVEDTIIVDPVVEEPVVEQTVE